MKSLSASCRKLAQLKRSIKGIRFLGLFSVSLVHDIFTMISDMLVNLRCNQTFIFVYCITYAQQILCIGQTCVSIIVFEKSAWTSIKKVHNLWNYTDFIKLFSFVGIVGFAFHHHRNSNKDLMSKSLVYPQISNSVSNYSLK